MANYADNVLSVRSAKYGQEVRQALVEIFQHHQEEIENLEKWLEEVEASSGSGGGENDDTPEGPSTTIKHDQLVVDYVIMYPTVAVFSDRTVVDYE